MGRRGVLPVEPPTHPYPTNPLQSGLGTSERGSFRSLITPWKGDAKGGHKVRWAGVVRGANPGAGFGGNSPDSGRFVATG
eukprot:758059-Hanusia_phi.AAC.3